MWLPPSPLIFRALLLQEGPQSLQSSCSPLQSLGGPALHLVQPCGVLRSHLLVDKCAQAAPHFLGASIQSDAAN